MAVGLYSGVSGLAVGTGLYKGVSGLWSGASGLIDGFGTNVIPANAIFDRADDVIFDRAGQIIEAR
jgi:hypothetical protein